MNQRHGVTLVETVVVMVLIGLLATFAWVALSRTSVRRAHATAAFANAMTEARDLAIGGGHDVVVMLDTAASELVIHEDRNNDGERSPDEPLHRRDIDPFCATPRPECTTPIWSSEAGATVAGPSGERFTEERDGMPALVVESGR